MRYYRCTYSASLKAVAILGGWRSIIVTCLAMALLAGCQQRVDDRIAKAYALARRPTEPNKNRIQALLGDEDRDVRATALVVMGTIDVERARRMAAGSLTDPDGWVRAAAVTLCGDGADAEMIRSLALSATDDPVWQVRTRALEAIAPSDEPAVAEAFARALTDSVRHVRRAALRAGIEHPKLLPIDRLSSLLATDPDWENRVDAAIALGASKEPAAYAGLDSALSDSNEFVRTTAARERRELESAGIPR